MEAQAKFCYPPVSQGGKPMICTFPEEYVQRALSDDDYRKLSQEYGVGMAEIKALVTVESNGSGFELQLKAPTYPKILLEAHHVYALTRTPVSRLRPDLSQPTWGQGRRFYRGGPAEWRRLLDLMALLARHGENPHQALLCCSWGLGQVMGFNFTVAGCTSVVQFVEQCHDSEYFHARHMMQFCLNNGILDDLRERDWRTVARVYNGPAFAVHNYHGRMAEAYDRFKRIYG